MICRIYITWYCNLEDIKWLSNRAAFLARGSDATRKLSAPHQKLEIRNYEAIHGTGSASAQGLAAIHRVDTVAGGDYWDIAGMGDAGVNSSIGGSWNPTRIKRLEAHAAKQAANGCPSVMVNLSSAPGCVDTY